MINNLDNNLVIIFILDIKKLLKINFNFIIIISLFINLF